MKQAFTALCLALAFGVAPAACQAPKNAAGISPDEQAIYETLLDGYLGKSTAHQLVALQLDPAPLATDPENSDCAAGARFPQAAGTPQAAKTLTGVTFRRPGIELIDAATWRADDPAKSLGSGDIKGAVERAFAHALISFSQVTFSTDRKAAIVSFGMSCGMLCGNGSTVQMREAKGRWRVARRCSETIS